MNLEQFETIDLRQKASGLTITDFCENEGYSISTFGYWRRQLKIKRKYDANAAFAPLIISSQTTSDPEHRSSSNRSILSSSSKSLVAEIKLPNGIELRLKGSLDPDFLRTLLTINGL